MVSFSLTAGTPSQDRGTPRIVKAAPRSSQSQINTSQSEEDFDDIPLSSEEMEQLIQAESQS